MKARVFMATTRNGLARATRAPDDEWSVEFLLADRDVRCLTADPLNPDVAYAGTRGSGVLRSDDRGETWRPAGLDGHNVRSLAASRSEPGAVYAGTKPALVYVSHDGGAHWRELDAFRGIRWRRFWGTITYAQAIALSPTDPNVMNVGIEGVAAVHSGDGGKTWTGHLEGALRDCHALVSHATDGDRVYEAGGTGAGAAISRDAGRTWTQQRRGLDRRYGWAAAADPADPDVWYVSASPGPWKAHGKNDARAAIFRSAGGGWERLSGGLPQPLDHMPYALLTDPEAPGHVYAGLDNGKVWHSEDYGGSWRQLPFDLKAVDRALVMLGGR